VTPLTPLTPLLDRARGRRVPLPRAIDRVYGRLRIPAPAGRPWTIANFAETIDGVVALDAGGPARAGEITGSSSHDHFVMGLLRAVADVVVVGAGTLRAIPNHRWTPGRIFSPMASEYAALRRALGKSSAPQTVVVSGSGRLDLERPAFSGEEAPVRILTTPSGARRLAATARTRGVTVDALRGPAALSARSILRTLGRPGLVLVEGGPRLLGTFLRDRALDELFVTIAPQVAGRDRMSRRPGLAAGVELAPRRSAWSTLVDARAAPRLLFLRYAFDR
jgi:riboflavin biosynthesis pyrimidine reductase